MIDKYELELFNKKEMLLELESKLFEVRLHLKNDPNNSSYQNQLRNISHDITIMNYKIKDVENQLNALKIN